MSTQSISTHRLSVRATSDLRLLLARVMPASDGVAHEPLDASDASGAAAAEPPPPESFLVQLRGSVQRPMEVLAAGPVSAGHRTSPADAVLRWPAGGYE